MTLHGGDWTGQDGAATPTDFWTSIVRPGDGTVTVDEAYAFPGGERAARILSPATNALASIRSRSFGVPRLSFALQFRQGSNPAAERSRIVQFYNTAGVRILRLDHHSSGSGRLLWRNASGSTLSGTGLASAVHAAAYPEGTPFLLQGCIDIPAQTVTLRSTTLHNGTVIASGAGTTALGEVGEELDFIEVGMTLTAATGAGVAYDVGIATVEDDPDAGELIELFAPEPVTPPDQAAVTIGGAWRPAAPLVTSGGAWVAVSLA
ncbi:MAG: hypothetical protein NVV66_18225 [Cellulomonas sp.]|uniref:hypothetical protein n=1 Tax=Cellulomonas sp. TaxID=40001 RepID=UPI002582E538|nr:hypothetical protein [Cellulomonas sp.]MCR6706534.1 hypothetical protein [Cellulomonas sp.]